MLDRYLRAHAVARVEDDHPVSREHSSRRGHGTGHEATTSLGVVRGLLDWLVGQMSSARRHCGPPRAEPPPTACRTCSMPRRPAGSWRWPAACPTRPGPRSGGSPTARSSPSLWTGAPRRRGRAPAAQRGRWRAGGAPRARHQVRQEPSRPLRPQMAALLREYLHHPGRAAAPPAGGAGVLVPRAARGASRDDQSNLSPPPAPPGARPPSRAPHARACTVSGMPLPSGRCCAGTARGSPRRTDSCSSSTFLGHVNPTSTAVYLTITADLLQEANQRFERWAAPTGPRCTHDPARLGARSRVLQRSPHGAQGLRPLGPELPRHPAPLPALRRGSRRRRRSHGLADLSFDRVLAFLRHLEEARHNQIRTRNQRLAALHTFFEYLASTGPSSSRSPSGSPRFPSSAVPTRDLLPRTRPGRGRCSPACRRTDATPPRDRALLLFLYNTGARVQEVSDLRRRD